MKSRARAGAGVGIGVGLGDEVGIVFMVRCWF
jgi:hypothetical protein